MKNIIHCEFQPQPGAIERILRVTRVRGFAIETMNAAIQNQLMKLEMTVTGERCFTNLCHQLEKLHEVQHASHITTVRSQLVRKLA